MLVQLKDIKKIYHTEEIAVEAIKGISLDIEEGKFISFIGASGAGKSTLLNMIGCIDKASEGELTVNGVEVSKLNRKEIAKFRGDNIGFIFQNFNLLPVLTIFENIEYALTVVKKISKTEAKPLVEQILKDVGMSEQAHKYPTQISGGQKQRVAIARALVTNPKIVIADEPTANLDSVNSQNIIKLMHEMKNKYKTTFIFSTHDPKVVKEAEVIFEIEDGLLKSVNNEKYLEGGN